MQGSIRQLSTAGWALPTTPLSNGHAVPAPRLEITINDSCNDYLSVGLPSVDHTLLSAAGQWWLAIGFLAPRANHTTKGPQRERPDSLDTSLVAAAGEGQLAELQKMHANDPRSIMLCDQGGTTCLLAAVRARQAAVVHWIVAGEDVSAEHKRW